MFKKSLSLLAGLVSTSAAIAQPSIIMTGFAPTALTPDGQFAVGRMLDSETNVWSVVKWSRASGTVDLGGDAKGLIVVPSNDSNSITYAGGNAAGLNNASNTIVWNPNVPSTWENTQITHVWTPTSGHQNGGMFSTANTCTISINTPADISGNGRYIAASGYTNGSCGAFRAQRFDTQTNTWIRLPASISAPPANAPSRATRANAISDDGTVIVGYDENYNSNLTFVLRRAAVWVRNSPADTYTLTALDPNGGEAYAVSGDGSVIIGVDSSNAACRWTRSGNTWVKTLFGTASLPRFVSSNGEWVIGNDWIWNASLNGGQIQNLRTYLTSTGLDLAGFEIVAPNGSAVWGISDDGQQIAVRFTDTRDPCLSTGAGAVVHLNTVPCVAPSFAREPVGDQNVVFSPGFYGLGVIVNVSVSGTGPINYQWQKQDFEGGWYDLIDDPFCTVSYAALTFDVKASRTSQLRLGFLNGTWPGVYRCIATGPCGSVTSDPVLISPPPPGCDSLDFNNDSLFPDDSDLIDLLSVLAGGPCSNDPPAGTGCNDIDFNNDGLFPDDSDLIAFLRVLAGGEC